MKDKTTLIAIFLAIFTISLSFSQVVTSGADDGSDGTLRKEIADTAPGGTISFVGVSTVTLNSELVIDKDLTIDGIPVTTVTIDANNNGRVFNVTAGNLTLNDLTITNGLAYDGGGIYMTNASVTINNSVITNNIANGVGTPSGSGGGIFNDVGGVLVVNDSEISNNTANRAGGGVEDKTAGGTTITTTLNNVNLLNNNAGVAPAIGNPGNGGGIHVSSNGSVNIIGGSAIGNVAALEGGGLWNGFGTMTVDGTTIDGNDAQGAASDNGGGGIFNNGGTLVVTATTTITNNTATGALGSGGGIFTLSPGTLSIDGLTIENNTANRAGGGIEIASAAGETYIFTDVTLNANTVNGPTPGNGGGLHITGMGNVVYNGGDVTNNIAFEGGGLWNSVGSMDVNGTTVTGNTANGDATGGGGLFNNGGTLNVNATTTLTGNIAMAATPGGRGGAIFNNTGGTLNVAPGSTISGNYASRAGGGIEDASNSTLTLNNVTLSGNSAGVDIGLGAMANPGNGGAIHLSGTTNAIILDSSINSNVAAQEGGGLWNNHGSMTVSGSTVNLNDAQGNDATDGGGGIFNNGGTLIVNVLSLISNNTATGSSGSGGGIFSIAGALTIDNSDIIFNSANRAGGGIEVIDGTLTVTNTTLDSNNAGGFAPAPGNGGGLHITGAANADFTGGTVNSNIAAREGGGLWNGSGIMTLDDVIIDANTATGNAADDGGAGIFNNGGTLNVTNNTIVSNNIASGASASGGGLLSTAGDVTVTNSTFDSNSANRAGGAIELIDGNLTFTNSVMSNNDVDGTAGTAAPGNGGGFHVTGMSGTVTISTSTITGNAAANEGGGLWNQNGTTMNVSMSTIDNNTAGEGGGIYNNTGSISTVMTSTISGNSASISGGGLTNNGASLDLNAVTVVENTSAGNGGGIDAVNNVSVKNTIVALNTATSGTDVSGILTSNDYNLIGTDDLNVFTPQTNDIEGADPVVGPLQDNGGTTFTHQLLSGSPAFNTGDTADTFVDQIGQSVFGAARDIGAFESQVALSVEDFNEVSVLSIYPNPTKGEFNIVIDQSITGNVNVQVVSMTGKLVKELAIGNGINNIDITGVASGIYIINITTETNNSSHKLILD